VILEEINDGFFTLFVIGFTVGFVSATSGTVGLQNHQATITQAVTGVSIWAICCFALGVMIYMEFLDRRGRNAERTGKVVGFLHYYMSLAFAIANLLPV
jgi:hypothetical protein